MSESRLNVRVDENTKKQAEIIFQRLGLTMSTGINIFLSRVAATQGIPFPLQLDGWETIGAKASAQECNHKQFEKQNEYGDIMKDCSDFDENEYLKQWSNYYKISNGHCEDIIIYKFLSDIKNGIYIDVGCSDPVKGSVTYLFYNRGWSGINIDPRDCVMEKYVSQRNRDINLCSAVSNKTCELMFFEHDGASTFDIDTVQRLSSPPPIGKNYKFIERKVKLTTLNEIICTHLKNIDINFLKIDVEHYEAQVLEGIDLQKYRPWLIDIEATQPYTSIPTHTEWENKIITSNYKFITTYGSNRYYIADEHVDHLIKTFISNAAVPFLLKKHWVMLNNLVTCELGR